nr:hypothetical protein CFP56_10356 [Quercus suber]
MIARERRRLQEPDPVVYNHLGVVRTDARVYFLRTFVSRAYPFPDKLLIVSMFSLLPTTLSALDFMSHLQRCRRPAPLNRFQRPRNTPFYLIMSRTQYLLPCP